MTPVPRLRADRPLALLVALLVLGSALPAASAEGPPTAGFGERLEVELVEVDVLALGRDGRPVIDLGRDELRVFDDDRPVSISQFTAPGPLAAASAAAARPIGAEPLRLVLFIDQLAMGPAGHRRVLAALDELVAHGLGEDDEVMVASFDGALRVVMPFSRNRKQLGRALASLSELTAANLVADIESQRALEQLEMEQFILTQGARNDPCTSVGQTVKSYAEQVQSRVVASASALTRFVDSLSGMGGRKIVIHVSDGIPLLAGGEAWQYAIELCDGTGLRAGLSGAFDVTSLGGLGRYTRFDPVQGRMDMQTYDTTPYWRQLAAHAAAQQVTFYTLQASGLAGLGGTDAGGVRTTFDMDNFRRRNKQDTLVLLARETGGRAVINANDLSGDLDRALSDERSVYRLAYVPPEVADGRQHAIRVEVARPGVELRHRQVYQARTARDRVIDGVLASLYHGSEENPLGARLELVGRTPAGTEQAKVRVRVRLPLSALVLLPEGELRQGVFSIYLVARDERGGTTPVRSKSIPVRLPLTGTPPEYVYEVEIELTAPPYDLATGVQDELGGVTSYLRLGLASPTS